MGPAESSTDTLIPELTAAAAVVASPFPPLAGLLLEPDLSKLLPSSVLVVTVWVELSLLET